MTPLYRIEELRALEAHIRTGLPAGTLMRRAGEAAAQAIDEALRALAPGGDPVLVLCGPGDNGGDGFVCAEALRRRGRACVCWAPVPAASPDARSASERWSASGGTTLAALPGELRAALVVDAIFGIGANRPLQDPFLSALRRVHDLGVPVYAIDVPSGLDADTGAWVGGVPGAAADATITFLGDKPGLHTNDGPQAAGVVHLAALGAESIAGSPRPMGVRNEPSAFASALQPRRRNSSKGDNGTVCVIGGAAGMVGAAILAGRAALRLGAGKVFIDCVGDAQLHWDPLQPELMFRPGRAALVGEVLVVGCGMGTGSDARARLAAAIAHAGPLVLDADALNCLAGQTDLRVAGRKGAALLTPHPGEAGRLLGVRTAEVQSDRIKAATRLARAHGAVVVLKGAGTVIAEPSGHYAVNPTGGPALASAGTGDVLAGMIGALLAQGAEAVPAARAAVWLHGRAADAFGDEVGLAASDIPARAAHALSALRREIAPALRPADPG